MVIQKIARQIIISYMDSREITKMMGRYHPSDYTGEEKFDDIGMIVWKTEEAGKDGMYHAIAYAGKANKPLWHFRFRDEQRMRKQIDETVDRLRKRKKMYDDRKQERMNYKHDFVVGDILYSSWGYEQNNIDFYQVIEVKNKAVVIREIANKIVGDSGTSNLLMPIKDDFIGKQPMLKIVNNGSVKINSSSYAYKWDGRPKAETMAQYGH